MDLCFSLGMYNLFYFGVAKPLVGSLDLDTNFAT